jgi:prephenate dehydratase
LHILAESIETYKKNFTRFLFIARSDVGIKTDLDTADKVSIVFTTQHKSGSLHSVLAILANNACNLTKIQSVPVMDNPWNYMFFCDFTLENMPILNDVLKLIRTQTVSLEVLGVYKSFS